MSRIPRCPYCGEAFDYIECEDCGGEGVVEHDCGEDTCCCRDPQPNVLCRTCGGEGGWYCEDKPCACGHVVRVEYQ